MDEYDLKPIYASDDGEYWEGNCHDEYSCGQCMTGVGDGEEIEDLIALGLKEGWLKKVEE